jgi:hypothetical protein
MRWFDKVRPCGSEPCASRIATLMPVRPVWTAVLSLSCVLPFAYACSSAGTSGNPSGCFRNTDCGEGVCTDGRCIEAASSQPGPGGPHSQEPEPRGGSERKLRCDAVGAERCICYGIDPPELPENDATCAPGEPDGQCCADEGWPSVVGTGCACDRGKVNCYFVTKDRPDGACTCGRGPVPAEHTSTASCNSGVCCVDSLVGSCTCQPGTGTCGDDGRWRQVPSCSPQTVLCTAKEHAIGACR